MYFLGQENGKYPTQICAFNFTTVDYPVYWTFKITLSSIQQGLCRFFRKHKTVKNLKTATIKQVTIHLSNLLKCFFIQTKSLCIFLVKKMESTLPKYAPSISQLLIIPCIGHSRSHFLPLVLKEKTVLICLSLSFFCAAIYQ